MNPEQETSNAFAMRTKSCQIFPDPTPVFDLEHVNGHSKIYILYMSKRTEVIPFYTSQLKNHHGFHTNFAVKTFYPQRKSSSAGASGKITPIVQMRKIRVQSREVAEAVGGGSVPLTPQPPPHSLGKPWPSCLCLPSLYPAPHIQRCDFFLKCDG